MYFEKMCFCFSVHMHSACNCDGTLSFLFCDRHEYTWNSLSMKPYAVVRFLGTDEVEAVPMCWLKSSDESTICYWPTYPSTSTTRIMHAITERMRPADDWLEHEALLIKKCGKCLLLHLHL